MGGRDAGTEVSRGSKPKKVNSTEQVDKERQQHKQEAEKRAADKTDKTDKSKAGFHSYFHNDSSRRRRAAALSNPCRLVTFASRAMTFTPSMIAACSVTDTLKAPLDKRLC
jgi:hypothetical protein